MYPHVLTAFGHVWCQAENQRWQSKCRPRVGDRHRFRVYVHAGFVSQVGDVVALVGPSRTILHLESQEPTRLNHVAM